MYLVTGGAGFIGSNIVKRLLDAGESVIIIDRITNDKLKNISGLAIDDFFDYGQVDLFSFGEKYGPKIKGVFHQGACSSTTNDDYLDVMTKNYEFTKGLFLLCQDYGIPIVYASSAAVYGNSYPDESPLNVYGFSKFMADRFLKQYAASFNRTAVGLRYFNVYGPGEQHKGNMASMIHQIYKAYPDVELFEGSENFKRDFVFVDDVVDVNMHFMFNPRKTVGYCDVGTGNARSFLELYNIVRRETDRETEYGEYRPPSFKPMPPEIAKFYQTHTQACIDPLRTMGFTKAFTTLEEGVRKSIEGYRYV